MADADVRAVSSLCYLLSEPTRLRLLHLVLRRERNVTDLCAAMGLSQPTVSHHLGLLRRSGVLLCRRDGKRIYYRPALTVALVADGTVRLEARGLAVRIDLAPKGLADAEATRTATADPQHASTAVEQETACATACG